MTGRDHPVADRIDHVLPDTKLDDRLFIFKHIWIFGPCPNSLRQPTEAKREGFVSTEG